MKSTRLLVEYEYEFSLFGVITQVKEHKLAWSINKFMGLKLVKQDDIQYDFQKGGRMYISNFIYETEYSYVRLLKNKPYEFSNIQKPYLLSELKDYDYFIQLEGEIEDFDDATFREALQSLNEVQYVTKVEVSNLKSKENLLF